ncbi:hypothetical protein BY996DRAFT_8397428 [Phakopsora pachyrhizi]|nr:hypothetical protein BY996DRAFT_8397428 [Phakopsora pachyrhizi]
MPLQPAKQRKTTPFKRPRRLIMIGPIESDPDSQKFRLLENTNTIFVIREPNSIPNLDDGIGALQAHHLSLDTEHQQDKTSTVKTVTEGLDGLGLYHPILSHPQELSLPTAMRTDNSLLPPLRNLSKKFGVSRLMIEMLSGEKRRGRVMNRKKNMRSLASEVVLLLWQLGLATERW